jgi:hypothetical protein
LLDNNEFEIDPFLLARPKKQRRTQHDLDEEDEVDELLAASESTDYEGEDTYDSDDDAISDEMVK